ncbi:MAG TPA: hypothetical protein DCQ90_00350 [Erysipelotrichaceae bacterium]|nr:MAG: hypothetical protein A2Y19_09915 [Firmicutes bacterium GWE2_51_13]HAO60425.1 hypothetical protein [Erysipelotrichaceae bacterium]
MDKGILSYVSISFNGSENIIKLIVSKMEISPNFSIKNTGNHLGLTYSGELIEFSEKLNYVVGFIQENFAYLNEIDHTDFISRVYCSILLNGISQFGFDLDPGLLNVLSQSQMSFSIDFW